MSRRAAIEDVVLTGLTLLMVGGIVAGIVAIIVCAKQDATVHAEAKAQPQRFTVSNIGAMPPGEGWVIHDTATGRDYLAVWKRTVVELAPVPAAPAEAKP